MTRMRLLLRTACHPEIAWASLKVSLFVGALLNGGMIDWRRGILNFLVPYCVASYCAAQNAIRK